MTSEGLSGWEVTENGGDGWLAEEEAAGTCPAKDVFDDVEREKITILQSNRIA